jgi:hypothetical protein
LGVPGCLRRAGWLLTILFAVRTFLLVFGALMMKRPKRLEISRQNW